MLVNYETAWETLLHFKTRLAKSKSPFVLQLFVGS